jgi:AraC-like DNA-binding protein
MLLSPQLMEYQEFPPSPSLARIVECLWTLSGEANDLSIAAQPVLPDGRPELVLHFGDPFERLHPDGAVERQPSVIFAGQLTSQLTLRPTGRICALGVRFHPHGAASLLKVPQHEFAGLTLGLDTIAAPLNRALADVRDAARNVAHAASLVQNVLLQRVDYSTIDPRVQFAVDAIGRTRGCLAVDDLAWRAGLTRRHLERLFLITVGVSPKRLARIARFQHALRLLERCDPSRPGTETAAACSYADQAHFIRDFRDLAGCTPGEHLLRRGELTGFFTERG